MKWYRIGELTILALIVINASELILLYRLRHDSRMYATVGQFPIPSGYSKDGSVIFANKSSCYLIRLSSDRCPFCRQDQPLYQDLASKARNIGCSVIVLAPKVGQIEQWEPNVLPLQFIDMQLGRVLNPSLTPETLMLNRDGRLVWDQEGSLDTKSFSGAVRALRALQ